jgi:hypothetical protein
MFLSSSSIISLLPIDANVVHLQFLEARWVHLLCALNLQTEARNVLLRPLKQVYLKNFFFNLLSHDNPWLVTPFKASRHTLQNVGLACEQTYQLWVPFKISFYKKIMNLIYILNDILKFYVTLD